MAGSRNLVGAAFQQMGRERMAQRMQRHRLPDPGGGILASMTLSAVAPIAAGTFSVPARYIGLYTSLVYLGATASSLIAPNLIIRYGALRISQGTVVCAAAGLFVNAGWKLTHLAD